MHTAFRFNVLELLQDFAERSPDWPALTTDKATVTFGDLLGRVRNWVGHLETMGVQPGQRVGLTIPDEITHLELTWAIASCAAASYNIPSFRPTEQRRKMAKTAALNHHITTDSGHAIDHTNAHVLPKDFSPKPSPSAGRSFTDANAELLLFSTSGTTAAPKVFARNVGFMSKALISARQGFDQMYEDENRQCTLLRGGSVEHDNHRVARFSQVLAGGANSIMTPFKNSDVSEFCKKTGVTLFGIGGYQLRQCVSDPNVRALPDDVMLVVGGAPITRQLREQVLNKFTKLFYVTYATSEVGTISTATPEDHLKAENCIGRPGEGIQISIRDAQGSEVDCGVAGHAWVKSQGALTEYISGQNAVDQDGWFATGDILSRLPDGCLAFHGRKDDMMSLNGINIYPQSIEDYLTNLPFISDAVAYGLPSEQHGCIPVASVVLKPDHHAPEMGVLLKMCRENLGLQSPRRIFFRTALPRNEQGKAMRRLLIQEWLNA